MQNGLKFLMGMLVVSSTGLMAKELHNSYSLALVGMSMDYKEYAPQLLDSEKSTFIEIGGFEMAYGYILSNESKINASVMYVTGYTDYVGSALGSGNPYGSLTSRTTNNIVDIALSYTRYKELSYGLTLDYGAGVGYRYWERTLSTIQNEVYDWFSLRARVGLTKDINNRFSVNVGSEYQYGIKPNMYASNLGANFTLGSADILKGNIGLAYGFSPKLDIFMDASLEKQTIGHSNIVASGGVNYLEPDSTAYNKYLKFGVVFKY